MKKNLTILVIAMFMATFGAGVYNGITAAEAAKCARCNPRTCAEQGPDCFCACEGCVCFS